MNKIESFKEFKALLKQLKDSHNLFDVAIFYNDNGSAVMTQVIEHLNNDNLLIEEDYIKVKHDDIRVKFYDSGWQQYNYNDSYEFILATMGKDDMHVEIAFEK